MEEINIKKILIIISIVIVFVNVANVNAISDRSMKLVGGDIVKIAKGCVNMKYGKAEHTKSSSAFTRYCYIEAKIKVLNENLQKQYEECKKISEKQALPGDLIFFKNTNNKAGVTHVGIYMGENLMIDNKEIVGVGYTELTKYWKERIISYGRY